MVIYTPFHFHGAWPSSSFSYDLFMLVSMVYNREYWNMVTFEWQYISCKSFLILKAQVSNGLYCEVVDGLTIWQSLLLTLRMLVVFFHKLFGFMVTFFGRFFSNIKSTCFPLWSNSYLTSITPLIEFFRWVLIESNKNCEKPSS